MIRPRELTSTLLVLAILLMVAGLPAVVLATWSASSTVNNPICTATNEQAYPQLVSDGSGGAIIAWQDHRGGINADIYAQRVDASGSANWTDNGTAICTANYTQVNPQLVSDGSGGAIIVWQDYRSGNYDIYAQRVDASGSANWTDNGTAICTANNTQGDSQLVSDGSGGAIIVWQDYRNYDIYAQRVDASGSADWTDNGTAICTANNTQDKPQLVSDGSGGAIIVWQDYRSGNHDIYAQRVDASGSANWTDNGTAICTATNEQSYPQLVSDGSGGAIIAWQDYRSGNYDIYAQRVDASGSANWTDNGTAICTADYTQQIPQLVSDGSGGAIIAWRDDRSGNHDIYAQRVDASGSALWTGNGTAICTATNTQEFTQLVSDGSGGAIIAWQDYRSGNYDIYAQRVDASGSTNWTDNGTAICTANNSQESPQLVSDGSGGAIIAWKDYRSGNYDIYAQRVNSSGSLGPPLDISVSPTTLNFGSVAVGSSGLAQTVTISNDGIDNNLNIGTITIGGTNAAEFSKQNDTASGQTIAPGGNATLQVVFSPSSAGAKTASLSIPSDDPDEATVTVSLSGSSPSPAPPSPPVDEGEPSPPPAIGRVSDIVNEEGVFTSLYSLSSDDEKVTLFIPKGTTGLTAEGEPISKVTITKVSPPDPPANTNFIGLTYDLEPDGATFEPSITLTFTYNPAWIPEEVSPENLTIAYWDEDSGKWVELDAEDITIDTERNIISADINHFTYFSVIAYVRPAAISVSDLTITPAEVDIAERVAISVMVTNTGDLPGSYVASLEINGKEASTQKVTVAGHTAEEINFTWLEGKPQTYEVNVNGLSGTFTVKPASTEPIVVKAPPGPAITLAPPAPTPPLPSPTPPSPAPTPWWLFVVIAVGTVFVLALALWLFAFRTK